MSLALASQSLICVNIELHVAPEFKYFELRATPRHATPLFFIAYKWTGPFPRAHRQHFWLQFRGAFKGFVRSASLHTIITLLLCVFITLWATNSKCIRHPLSLEQSQHTSVPDHSRPTCFASRLTSMLKRAERAPSLKLSILFRQSYAFYLLTDELTYGDA